MAWRLLRFLTGLAVGLACVAASYVLLRDLHDKAHDGAVGVRTSGADMSAQGAVRLVVQRRSGVFTQTCNGPCDDLRMESPHGSDSVSYIRVANARGDCMACVKGQGDTPTGRRDDWTIAGAPRLGVTKVRAKALPHG
jgi:hypothetical protein